MVLKQLLIDKGIVFSSKAKKLELVHQIFNTQAGYVTAYDGCFPKPKQFYSADKHPQKKSIFLSAYLLVSFSDWLVTVQLFCY